MPNPVRKMSWSQQQRMNFIREKIASDGYVNRLDVIDRFEVSFQCVSADFKWLMNNEPDLMAYNLTTKRYERKVK